MVLIRGLFRGLKALFRGTLSYPSVPGVPLPGEA
jgi:hypothetical protein